MACAQASRAWYNATLFKNDVAVRIKIRVQLTTDGYKPYLEAITDSFGSQVDFAQIVKLYCNEGGQGNEKKYSPLNILAVRKALSRAVPMKSIFLPAMLKGKI